MTHNSATKHTSVSTPSLAQRGASLIDLLIVMCIIALVLTVAVPSIRTGLELQRLDASASKLGSKLTEARFNAIKTNRETWLLIDPSLHTLQVQTTDPSGNTIDVGGTELLSTGISIGPGPTRVTFDSLGLTGSTQTFTLTGSSTGRTKIISVSLLGHVRVGPIN